MYKVTKGELVLAERGNGVHVKNGWGRRRPRSGQRSFEEAWRGISDW